jgi:rare lipoprotein A
MRTDYRLLGLQWYFAVSALAFLIGCASTARYGGHGERQGEKPAVSFRQTGMASYYAHEFHGRKTASGERYNMNDLTAAHRTLPFNTRVRVTNLSNDKSVIVRINDRGPFKKRRIIDLSLAAAKKIDLIGPGSAKVRIEIIE